MRYLLTVIGACAALATVSVASDAPLRATVSPRIGAAPALVRVQAIIVPAAENDALLIVIDSAAYYRSSTIPLDGDAAPRVHLVDFRSVPAGVHEITVALLDRRGEQRAAVTSDVRVFP
jgi:hypothetical protein